jgi:hypothetical protein
MSWINMSYFEITHKYNFAKKKYKINKNQSHKKVDRSIFMYVTLKKN